MARAILWLFVIALRLDLGAGVYEARVVVPFWAEGVPHTLAATDPFARVQIAAGVGFWAYMTSIVAILAVLTAVLGFRAPAPQRLWQLAAGMAEIAAITTDGCAITRDLRLSVAAHTLFRPPPLGARATFAVGYRLSDRSRDDRQ